MSHLTNEKYRSVVPETHTCKCTYCEGTCSFGKFNTRFSPDVLCSCSRWLWPLVWFHVCPCIDVVIKTRHCYVSLDDVAIKLLYCFCFYIYISGGGPILLNKHVHNLKAQKVNSLKSLKQLKSDDPEFKKKKKRHKGNTGTKEQKKACQHTWGSWLVAS